MDETLALPDLTEVITTFAEIPHSRRLGLRVIDLRHGKGFMAVPYDEGLIGNPVTRVVHGGVITALLDTLSGMVVMSVVPKGTAVATLDLRIDYLHPALPGRDIRAVAEVAKRTESIAFVRGRAYHDTEGDAIAQATGTFMLGGGGFPAQTQAQAASG